MKIILNTETSPIFNLALEEYILDNFVDDDIVMLWRNEKSVIIGNNQNAFGEVDTEYIKEHGIALVRRLTGGGAVFHDLGNVNFTFISNYREGSFGDYSLFAEPVCKYLGTIGLKAEVSGRNDIIAGGVKISGNAQTVRRGRILQHGTLLYSSDLSELGRVLRPRKIKMESHGITSVKSRVGNIKEMCACSLSCEDFINELFEFLLNDGTEYKLSGKDIAAAQEIAAERYSKWEWNFGSSPSFSVINEQRTQSGCVEVCMNIENGHISQARIFGDFFGILPISTIEAALSGVKYDRESILAILGSVPIENYISGLGAEELARIIV